MLNNPLKYTDPSGHMIDPGGPAGKPKKKPPPDPDARYYYSEKYGWFDKSHFGSGDPKYILEQVDKASSEGRGRSFWVEGEQGGGDLSFHYKAQYWVSGDVTPDQVTGVALGIHMDFNTRFERWQGEWGDPTHSSFAIEDLPSDYIGFYAAKTGMTYDRIFGDHLGGVEGRKEEPPRHVKNYQFAPMVGDAAGNYVNVPWPKALDITPIKSDSGCWRFTSAEQSYVKFKDIIVPWPVHGPFP